MGWIRTGSRNTLKKDANCDGKLTIATRELQYCSAHIGLLIKETTVDRLHGRTLGWVDLEGVRILAALFYSGISILLFLSFGNPMRCDVRCMRIGIGRMYSLDSYSSPVDTYATSFTEAPARAASSSFDSASL